jgi:hypothetical protein
MGRTARGVSSAQDLSTPSVPRAEAADQHHEVACRDVELKNADDACGLFRAGRTHLSANTNVLPPCGTVEQGLEPVSFTSTVDVGFIDTDNGDGYDEDDYYDFEDQRFFCSRMGDVLVVGGDTFRLSACLPGAKEPPPDVPHLYSLHKARCYSPATG